MEGTNGSSGNQEAQLQEILQLIQSRSQGGVSNDDVEHAVERIIGPVAVARPAKQPTTPKIKADTDNYDDDDDESEEDKKEKVKPATKKRGRPARAATRNRTTKKKKMSSNQFESLYADIPLGTQAAQMLQIFGDGSPPLPETVRAVLDGAKRMTQVAIQDARHVRRQRKKAHNEAAALLKATSNKKLYAQVKAEAVDGQIRPLDAWSPETLYSAHTGYSSVAYNPKCGFDDEDLQELFPEEINAYSRWSSAYEEVTEDKDVDVKSVGNTNDDAKSKTASDPVTDDEPVGGHLQERAAQFDIRTDQMKNDRYMAFAELRKGSFLPRKGKAFTDDEDVKGRGWGNLPRQSIRFLHWAGFDPNSVLPPPKELTTQILAFLAYDFFGRIVEKAIELRISRSKKSGLGRNSILELGPGEKLEKADIDRAMQDPEIKPAPLYSRGSDGSDTANFQLYFGPGFENRLEMEMEEMISASRAKPRADGELMDKGDSEAAEDAAFFATLAKKTTG